MKRSKGFLFPLFLLLVLPGFAAADEGFWLFNKPPIQTIRQRYSFTVTPQWLTHFQLSSTNLDGSSAFVSPHGLVLSVHHGTPVLLELSTEDRDILRSGFYARTPEEELKCPNMELLVLKGIEDVTAQVLESTHPGMSGDDSAKAKKDKIAQLEASASEAKETRGSVVSLYAGNLFHLYRYKVYSDIRLVFSPEESIAFFGGDNDNFDYPRYCLDICLFRIWEDGKPLETPEYLRWSPKGPKEGELVFLSGTPSGTTRFLTVAQLEFLRDVNFPWDIAWRQRKRALLHAYGSRGPEEARLASIRVWGLENGLKAAQGYLSGLKDSGFLKKRAEAENDLREWIKQDPDLAKEVGGAWDEIAEAQKKYSSFLAKYAYFVNGLGFDTAYFRLARTIIRQASGEYPPDPRAIELPKPFDDALEIMTLTSGLEQLNKDFPDMVEVRWLLGRRTAEDAAKELISRTSLRDPKAVRELVDGGLVAVQQSNDLMIKLALFLEPIAKALRSRYEKEYLAVEEKNGGLILKTWLKLRGETMPPPDANGFLRLSYGTVKGLTDQSGKRIPFRTTYGSLYKKAESSGNKPPYELSSRFLEKKSSIDLRVGLNFVTTADAFGGNSGSPCINTKGELVGLLFDINPAALANRFGYDGTRARSILVDSRGILEALRKIYEAGPLADELLSRK
jgi:hypothetical protein